MLDGDPDSEDEDEEPTRRIVACPRSVIVASEAPTGTPFPIRDMPNYITQDDSPAENTRSKTRRQETILRMSDKVMMSCIQMTKQAAISPKAAASRKHPMQLLCKLLAGAVLDQDTGDLLEYRHLLKHPKLKETWDGGHAKKVRRLAQGLLGIVEGTDTIKFILKGEIPVDRLKDCTYSRIVCNVRPEKRIQSE